MAKGLRQLLQTLLTKEGYTRAERLEILDHSNYPDIRNNLFELLCLLIRKAKRQGKPLSDHILIEISIAAGNVTSASSSSSSTDIESCPSTPSSSNVASPSRPARSNKLSMLRTVENPPSGAPVLIDTRDISTQTETIAPINCENWDESTESYEYSSEEDDKPLQQLKMVLRSNIRNASSQNKTNGKPGITSNNISVNGKMDGPVTKEKFNGMSKKTETSHLDIDSDESEVFIAHKNNTYGGVPETHSFNSDIFTTECDELDAVPDMLVDRERNSTVPHMFSSHLSKGSEDKTAKLEQCISRTRALRACRLNNEEHSSKVADSTPSKIGRAHV